MKITPCKIKLLYFKKYGSPDGYTHTAESSDVLLIEKAKSLG